MATEFSNKALERYRKNNNIGPLKCKNCVSQAERNEREAAAAKRQQTQTQETTLSNDERRTCPSCLNELAQSEYNRNQWSKGKGKSRCRSCVEQALKDDAAQQSKIMQEQLARAKEDMEKANASGNALQVLKAESVLAALEAEKVTGLKPIKMARGGRGHGRSGGGHGRSGRGSARR